jgi:dATP/dGTP pyrophosphohydrolase
MESMADMKTITSFKAFQDMWGEWADKTFPKSTIDTIASHFREEAFEFAGGDKPVENYGITMEYTPPSHDPVEAADCMLLLLHHAHKHGYSLFDEMIAKAQINVKRDWDTTDEGGHGHFKHK